jgi:hypothetical protein
MVLLKLSPPVFAAELTSAHLLNDKLPQPFRVRRTPLADPTQQARGGALLPLQPVRCTVRAERQNSPGTIVLLFDLGNYARSASIINYIAYAS